MLELTIPSFCDCGSVYCGRSVNLPLKEALQIYRDKMILIINGCRTHPPLFKKLISKHDGYSFYSEK